MYSSFPKQDRIRIRLSLSLAWGFVALGGFSGVFAPPSVELGAVGWLPIISSMIVASFGAVATVGIALNNYRLEWVAAWFVAGGVFAYALLVWYLTISAGNNRYQAAALLSALMFFFAYRIVSCSAHARKQRLIHKLIQSDGPNA